MADSIISFLIVFTGFLYGLFRLFGRRKPLYFKLFVCACGCAALEKLSDLINEITVGAFPYPTLGLLGTFASLFFFLSANYGAIDALVDEHGKDPSFPGLAAPILFGLMLAYTFTAAIPHGIISAIILLLVLLPVLPTSYYALKHLLLPNDTLGILRATRLCNLFILLFCAARLAEFLIAIRFSEKAALPLSYVSSAAAAMVSLAAVRGEKAWKI